MELLIALTEVMNLILVARLPARMDILNATTRSASSR